jgi:hypothetical protein
MFMASVPKESSRGKFFVRGQKTEDRGQKTENRNQKTVERLYEDFFDPLPRMSLRGDDFTIIKIKICLT